MRSRSGKVLAFCLLAVVAAAALRLLADPDGIGLPRNAIEWQIRGSRLLAALTIGSALSAAGVLLQALLRNPLAAPSLLGLTSGASLGVMLWIYAAFLTTGAIATAGPPIAAAAVGSLATLGVVYAVAQRRGAVDPLRLILVGVVVSILCGAASMLLQHLLPDQGLAVSMRWLLGSIDDDARPIWIGGVAVFTSMCIAVAMWFGPSMDAASLGEDEAISVGVRVGALRLGLLFMAGLLTAGSVLLAGPIGFVGLICPHAARLIGGPSHRMLVLHAALLGGALIIGADAAVRFIDLGSGRIPVGVLTTLLGGPVFLVMLRERRLIQ